MTATEQMRAMLDQLMGTGRDGENSRYKVKFTDSRVCKSFLLGCCPHDILSATRMDLGECPRFHDLALRADYENSPNRAEHKYEIDAMEHLESFINECDRRTELAKKRLSETQEELSTEVTVKANKVHELAEQIGKKLASAEQLGAEGKVEESLKHMQDVDDIRRKKMSAENEYRNSMPASTYQQQKLRVCEVCSAYLGIHDNDRRLADHFGGKLHLGFIAIRDKLAELKAQLGDTRGARRSRSESAERYNRNHERDGDRRQSRSRSRDRARRSHSGNRRSPSRGRRERSRSGGRSSRRSRSRSRSRDRRRDDHRDSSRRSRR